MNIYHRLIGSLAVFLPSAWYLAQPQLNKKPHGGAHDHGSHGSDEEHGDESKEDEAGGADGDDEGESKEADSGTQTADGQEGDAPEDDSGEGESGNDGGEKSDQKWVEVENSNYSGPEGVQFKGPTKAGEDGKQTHNVVHAPDKGGETKKRLESNYGKVLGTMNDDAQSPENKDLVSLIV